MERHRWVTEELARHDPATDETTVWPGGHSLAFRAFIGVQGVPPELITSVRCIVTDGESVLVCEDSHPATHVWPGGRREGAETLEQTVMREVLEETGWTLDPVTLTRLGVVHFEHLTPMPSDHPFPHPDFVQVVMSGWGTPGPDGWSDTDSGYVERSYLMGWAEVMSRPITAAERAFLDAARSSGFGARQDGLRSGSTGRGK